MNSSTSPIGLSEDAAIVLALADTAVPFAGSPEDEAERWVRVLRLHVEFNDGIVRLGRENRSINAVAGRAVAVRPIVEHRRGAKSRRAERIKPPPESG